MSKYIIKRVFGVIGTMLLVSVVAFLFIHLIPGDPARILAGEKAPLETVEAIRKNMGLDDPLILQYFRWIGNIIFHGDFGTSFRNSSPVLAEIATKYPNTLKMAVAALIWSVIAGILTGVYTAVHAGKWQDYVGVTAAVIGQAVPEFWVGLMLIFLFGVKLHWLPVSSANGGLKGMIMPAFTLGAWLWATVARYTRSAMLETLRDDYIRTARAKGLAENKVIWKHAFRNSLISVVTIIGVSFGDLLGGAVLVESVFAFPGIGTLLINSISYRDYAVVQALILIISAHYVIINFIVDIFYAVINPEIRYT